MINQLNSKGYAEIESGAYLMTKEYLISEQESWPDEDNCKTFDFSGYDYWITNDDGSVPRGAIDIQDGIFQIFGVEACRKWLGE